MSTTIEKRFEELNEGERNQQPTKYRFICTCCGKPNNYGLYECGPCEAEGIRREDEA